MEERSRDIERSKREENKKETKIKKICLKNIHITFPF